MKRTNRIRVLMLVFLFSLFLGYGIADRVFPFFTRDKVIEEKTTEQPESEVLIQAEAKLMSYSYVIYGEGNYLTVYFSDCKTVYMYTNIRVDSLPSELREEVFWGKKFADMEELYLFLETYSS